MSMLIAAVLCTLAQPAPTTPPAPEPVPFSSVRLDDPYWAPRQKANATGTLEQNWAQCQKTGRLANLERAAKGDKGGHQGYFFNDSDVFKMVEGASYIAALSQEPALLRRIERLNETIAKAQQADGYLDTYFTLDHPEDQWKNLKDMHELYCAGHLIEAGVAHAQATGRHDLLDVSVRLADHIERTFGPGKRAGVCGHPEIELALIRLWQQTGERRHLDMARYFIQERGRGQGRELYGEYCQDQKPLVDQQAVVGHAVRAMYLYSAAADLARIDHDDAMTATLERLWDNLTLRKMYVTGGIGNSAQNEGFTTDYDLPNESAYAETCAGLGLVMWAQRMNILTGDAKYADVMERVLYNAGTSGVSLDGKSFFYVNPMRSQGGVSRQEWYACACCPPNLLRVIASVGGYQYVQDGAGLRVNLYAQGTATPPAWGPSGSITQQTRYPWDGKVSLRIEAPTDRAEWPLRLRLPAWCTKFSLRVNGEVVSAPVEKGYLVITRRWGRGDTVQLALEMPITRVVSHPAVKGNTGRVAVQRGPIVYCAEQADNPDGVDSLVLPAEAPIADRWEPDLLGGVVVLRAPAERAAAVFPEDHLYAPRPTGTNATLTLVPYSTWANRGNGAMSVWLAESPSAGLRAGKDWLRASVSHCFASDSIEALSDGLVGKASSDETVPRMTWWPRKGSEEWAQYDFTTPQTITGMSVVWFDDSGHGGCRLPDSWRAEWFDGTDWKPVTLLTGQQCGVAKDVANRVQIEPVTCRGIRLKVKLHDGASSGITEWSLERKG